jgi:uncharacterized phage protein (TIGR02218 family)
MKTSTSELRTLLHGSTEFGWSDLVTVTLADATVARWTDNPWDIPYGGNTYIAAGTGTAPILDLSKVREAIGLEVATMDVTIGCGTTAMIGGTSIRQLARQGLFDDARVEVARLYLTRPGVAVATAIVRFSGVVSDYEADSNEVRLRVQSDIYQFEEVLPRHLIREKCVWAFGDAGCGIVRSTLVVSDTAEASSTATEIKYTSATLPPWGFQGFPGGVLAFTSGALSGLSRTIASYWSDVVINYDFYLTVSVPFPVAPAVGDALTVTPGCDKTYSTCLNAYANTTRRRGFDFVPPPDSVG